LIVVKKIRSAAIFVGPDFVGDRCQHFLLQLRLNIVNLEYLTIYIRGHNEAATHTACMLLAENKAGQPIACTQYGSQPHSDQGLPWCLFEYRPLFKFIKILRRRHLHALMQNLGKKVFKKRNFIISARDGGKGKFDVDNSNIAVLPTTGNVLHYIQRQFSHQI